MRGVSSSGQRIPLIDEGREEEEFGRTHEGAEDESGRDDDMSFLVELVLARPEVSLGDLATHERLER